jgi:phage-related protein
MVRLYMNGGSRKKVSAVFYRSESGNEPVRDWLLGLSKDDRKAIGADIQTVEFGWPVGMPVCRPMKNGLYEVRTNLDNGRISRVLFCFHSGKMVLLHGFIKKSQKTPKPDLELAMKRKKEVDHG